MPFLSLFGLAVLFYWKVFFLKMVPIPGNMLIGAYYPWLESKWGFPTGVPFLNNPSMSDVFSQFYLWKSLIVESLRNFQIPLWNPYSYSGYPLLANYHSGTLYPLNVLLVLFGEKTGWSMLVVTGNLGSLFSMYLFLRQIGRSKLAAMTGGVVYAFSGFTISWSQFINAVQAMIWLPILLLLVDKYSKDLKKQWLWWMPLAFGMLFLAGHFQMTIYSILVCISFTIFRFWKKMSMRTIGSLGISAMLAVGVSMVQALPTWELMALGIRSEENATALRNFGLLPYRNFMTLLAPDFFGNPVKMNFWGFFMYHETIFYGGVMALLFIITSAFFWLRLDGYARYFLILGFLALLFGFATPFGQLVYQLKIAGISTSDAGRIAGIFTLALAVMAGTFFDLVWKLSRKVKLLIIIFWLSLDGVLVFCALNSANFWGEFNTSLLSQQAIQVVSIRNAVIPSLIILGISVVIMLGKKARGFLLVITIAELFNFGWKYTAYSKSELVFPKAESISFVQEKAKTEIFRIDRENAQVLPNATWMEYRLMSPSGYDPMAVKSYVIAHNRILNGASDDGLSRYSEIRRYDAEALGVFNVKYLFAVNWDDKGVPGGNRLIPVINQDVWKKVFESNVTVVLENTKYQSRARFVEGDGNVNITKYEPSKVEVSFTEAKDKTLLLADTWYPGWNAYINGKKTTIDKCEGIFRCLKINSDSGKVVYKYEPESFRIGALISGVSLGLTLLALLYGRTPRKFHFLNQTKR